MRKSVVLFAIIILSCLQIASQETKPQPWPQEPTSFLGIQFGQPLLASVVACPKITEYGITRYEWPNFGRPCFSPYSGTPGMYEVYNLHIFYETTVTEVNGKVEYISTRFKSWNALSVAQALKEKYGPPHYEKIVTVQNRMGASFDNHKLGWSGINIMISYESIDTKVDEGAVRVSTAIYNKSLEQNLEQKKDALKGVL